MNKRMLLVVEILAPIAIVAVWYLTSESYNSVYFPALSRILEKFREDWMFDRVAEDLLPSLTRLGAGYAIAVGGGIIFGTALGMNRILWQAFAPIIEFLRSLPPPVLIPFGLLVLGTGTEMKIFVIAIGSIWPVLLNSLDGVRGVDPTLHEVSRVYQVSRLNRIIYVILPAASPQIFAGMRTSLSISVILMVISEMVASVNGVGYYVLRSQRSFRIPAMWAGILVLGLIGYVLNLIFLFFEQRILRWHRGSRTSALGEAETR